MIFIWFAALDTGPCIILGFHQPREHRPNEPGMLAYLRRPTLYPQRYCMRRHLHGDPDRMRAAPDLLRVQRRGIQSSALFEDETSFPACRSGRHSASWRLFPVFSLRVPNESEPASIDLPMGHSKSHLVHPCTSNSSFPPLRALPYRSLPDLIRLKTQFILPNLPAISLTICLMRNKFHEKHMLRHFVNARYRKCLLKISRKINLNY